MHCSCDYLHLDDNWVLDIADYRAHSKCWLAGDSDAAVPNARGGDGTQECTAPQWISNCKEKEGRSEETGPPEGKNLLTHHMAITRTRIMMTD